MKTEQKKKIKKYLDGCLLVVFGELGILFAIIYSFNTDNIIAGIIGSIILSFMIIYDQYFSYKKFKRDILFLKELEELRKENE